MADIFVSCSRGSVTRGCHVITAVIALLFVFISSISAQEHGKSDILKAEAQHIRDVCVTMPCPMNWENIQNWAIFIGSLVAVFLASASGFAAGVGLGIVYTALFLSLLNFDLSEASFYSNAICAIGGLTVTLSKWNSRHPERPDQRLIDVEMVAMFIPLLLLGYSIGLFISLGLPSEIKIWLMLALLAVLVVGTSMRAWQEIRQAQKEHDDVGGDDNSQEPAEINDLAPVTVVLIEMALLWTCFVFVLWALEGTEEYTASWWIYQAVKVLVAISFSAVMMVQYDYFTGLQSSLLGKEAPVTQKPRKLTPKTGALVCLTGVAAQISLLGGGILLTPLLLFLGYHPMVAAATAAFMILIAGSAAAVELMIQGNFMYSWLLVYLAVAALGTLSGLTVVGIIGRRYSGRSTVTVLLAGLLLMTMVIVYWDIISDVNRVGPDFIMVEPMEPREVAPLAQPLLPGQPSNGMVGAQDPLLPPAVDGPAPVAAPMPHAGPATNNSQTILV